MIWITKAKHLREFQIEVRFNNGKTFHVDLKDHLTGKVFEPLKRVEEFAKFSVHPELDTIVWKSGADFAPEFLYELGRTQAKELVRAYTGRSE